MSKIKSPSEIAIMKEGGAILSKALKAAADAVRPGVTIAEVDAAGEAMIRKLGATPAFLDYRQDPTQTGFPSALCISVNHEVIHGPGNRKIVLKDGDIVGLDIGAWYKELTTDMATTVAVGKIDKDRQLLLERTRESLVRGLGAVKAGASIRSIGKAVAAYLQPFGYGIVRDFVGHGVGHKVHEPPNVPNYDEPAMEKMKLVEGMTIAIEPMVIMSGESRVDIEEDGWTVVSRDGSPAAHFEVTIAVTKDGYELLTPFIDR